MFKFTQVSNAKAVFVSASNKIRPLEQQVSSQKYKFDAANRNLDSTKRTLEQRKSDFDR